MTPYELIEKAKNIHGDSFDYEWVDGTTTVDLSKLKNNQRVCAGNKYGYILMTKIKK